MMRLSAGLLAVSVSGTALAAGPADYSPYPEVSIQTLRVEKRGKRKVVVVGIRNEAPGPLNVDFECVSYETDGEPITATGGIALAVPPGQKIAAESISFESASDRVHCRVRSINDPR